MLSLSAAGTALILDTDGPGLPRVVHWGADPGPLTGLAEAVAPSLEARARCTVLPAQAEGWHGRPAVLGHRAGAWPYLRLETEEVAPAEGGVRITARDAAAGVAVILEIVMEPSGVVRMATEVRNDGPGAYTLEAVSCQLPVDGPVAEVLDFTGRWAAERSPQRGPLRHGLTLRESRRGKTGHDATGLLIAGSAGFGFRSGEVWAVHTGWSGDHAHWLESLPEAAPVLAGGELLGPGEVELAPGAAYRSPWVFFAWSGEGLDGLAARLHERMRARAGHPRTPRRVILNTWEAVYFDHDLAKLSGLAERAAGIGAELFVLDDGWFRGRRDDTSGLGDWTVDREVWPDGLHPLVKQVRSLGMAMGLWVEPEMVNPDSDLAREHPDWILAAPGRLPALERNQLVLDVANPEAYAYLLAHLDRLVAEYDLDYLKWDHNRDLLEPIHDGRAGVHEQTLATYRLLDELRARHPGLEIESCAGGGGRIDYGILERTDRVWASDTNDPLQRQAIQRWTGLLLPPELIGSHVGAARAHITGRSADLPFRLATALFAHAGIEWDITTCSPAELRELAAWIGLYKRLRPLLHTGRRVTADHPDPQAWLHGVVAPDRRQGVFALAQLGVSVAGAPPRLRLPGLDPAAVYTVTACPELALPRPGLDRRAPWLARPVQVSGAVLASAGLTAPLLDPAQAVVFEVRS
ncbi:alpha-galactosidase [Actinoplanes subtropicus]|uniref:alpha-galactosidase n=1 Tax=Actinoplanes subtropicus TaxID=543632 RepID=UPI0004C3D180|nr:alpha-galactosidase [Actinoplanes subtropicus]